MTFPLARPHVTLAKTRLTVVQENKKYRDGHSGRGELNGEVPRRPQRSRIFNF